MSISVLFHTQVGRICPTVDRKCTRPVCDRFPLGYDPGGCALFRPLRTLLSLVRPESLCLHRLFRPLRPSLSKVYRHSRLLCKPVPTLSWAAHLPVTGRSALRPAFNCVSSVQSHNLHRNLTSHKAFSCMYEKVSCVCQLTVCLLIVQFN